MRRKTLLSLSLPTPRTKWQALALESGYSGITRQLLDRGEGCLVVARDGTTYEMRCWPKSQTFRSGNQENLLIADNKTREYDTADEETRRLLRLRTWGPMGERVEGRAQRGVNDSPGEATAP